jgi:hypothetical protein
MTARYHHKDGRPHFGSRPSRKNINRKPWHMPFFPTIKHLRAKTRTSYRVRTIHPDITCQAENHGSSLRTCSSQVTTEYYRSILSVTNIRVVPQKPSRRTIATSFPHCRPRSGPEPPWPTVDIHTHTHTHWGTPELPFPLIFSHFSRNTC